MKKIFLTLIISLIFIGCSFNQNKITVGFYNLENLFDTIDDIESDTTLPGDSEFLPNSAKLWDEVKLDKKMGNLSRVIRLMNDGNGPDILGVCESENKRVLKQMIDKYLADLNYSLIYYESNDSRGIDVGLLYKSNLFDYINSHPIKIESIKNTRDILFSQLKFKNDTLNLFVNHWPSRRGGESESEIFRIMAATKLKEKVDSLIEKNKNSKIIICGDFNDMPNNKSISSVLGATELIDCNKDKSNILYNTAYKKHNEGEGTYYFQSNFNMLDQIIISKGLLNSSTLSYECDSFRIFKNEINTTRSGKFEGAPFPTYAGNRYLGGYSDHFPVLIKLLIK